MQKSPKLWNRKTGEPINLYFDSLMTPFLDAGTKKCDTIIDISTSIMQYLRRSVAGEEYTMSKIYRAELVGVFGCPIDENPTGVVMEAALQSWV